MQLQSRVGVGSTFTIWLPVAPVEGASRPRGRPVRATAELPAQPRKLDAPDPADGRGGDRGAAAEQGAPARQDQSPSGSL